MDLIDRLVDLKDPKLNRPVRVFIGGPSRAGKTTFTKCISMKLAQRGYRCVQIHLDYWILPVNERDHAHGVLQRFDIGRLSMDLGRLFSGETVEIRPYNPITRLRDTSPLLLAINKNADFVFVEGVIALADPHLRSFADLRIFVETTRFRRLKRLLQLYRDEKKIDREVYRSIIKEREVEEVLLVNTSKTWADETLIS
jgi:uridine kinase